MHGDLDAASSKKNEDGVNPEFSFHNKSLKQRSLILFAGPAANFIFSFLILVFINSFFGYTTTKPIISEIETGMSASQAGLKVGDIIIEVNKEEISDLIALKEVVSRNNNKDVEITYSRDSKVNSTIISIRENKIGIKGTVETEKLNFFDSMIKSGSQIYFFVKVTLVGIFEMITGSRGTEDLGGPIRIAELSADFWSKGIHSTLWFMMIISLNLGLINLFPIPMLDGGHLLLNLIEFVKGSPLEKKSLEIIHTFGLIILLSLMVFATYNDVLRIIK